MDCTHDDERTLEVQLRKDREIKVGVEVVARRLKSGRYIRFTLCEKNKPSRSFIFKKKWCYMFYFLKIHIQG